MTPDDEHLESNPLGQVSAEPFLRKRQSFGGSGEPVFGAGAFCQDPGEPVFAARDFCQAQPPSDRSIFPISEGPRGCERKSPRAWRAKPDGKTLLDCLRSGEHSTGARRPATKAGASARLDLNPQVRPAKAAPARKTPHHSKLASEQFRAAPQASKAASLWLERLFGAAAPGAPSELRLKPRDLRPFLSALEGFAPKHFARHDAPLGRAHFLGSVREDLAFLTERSGGFALGALRFPVLSLYLFVHTKLPTIKAVTLGSAGTVRIQAGHRPSHALKNLIRVFCVRKHLRSQSAAIQRLIAELGSSARSEWLSALLRQTWGERKVLQKPFLLHLYSENSADRYSECLRLLSKFLPRPPKHAGFSERQIQQKVAASPRFFTTTVQTLRADHDSKLRARVSEFCEAIAEQVVPAYEAKRLDDCLAVLENTIRLGCPGARPLRRSQIFEAIKRNIKNKPPFRDLHTKRASLRRVRLSCLKANLQLCRGARNAG